MVAGGAFDGLSMLHNLTNSFQTVCLFSSVMSSAKVYEVTVSLIIRIFCDHLLMTSAANLPPITDGGGSVVSGIIAFGISLTAAHCGHTLETSLMFFSLSRAKKCLAKALESW